MQEKSVKKPLKRIAHNINADGPENVKKLKKKLKKSNELNDETKNDNAPVANGKKKPKRKAEELSNQETENSTKKIKKHKQVNGEVEKDEQFQQGPKHEETEKSIKKIDTSIFQYFTNLTQENEDQRIKAATQLIQQLQKTKEPEKRQKELTYALKRLIRGCGAATNISRAGFFTGLVAFLKTFGNDEIAVNTIFDIIQKELHVGATIANKEDADAVVGKILVCGALLRSERISQLHCEHLERVTNILLQATKHRTYHASLGYAFLIEILETALTQQQFEEAVWPLLLKELCKPWPKQTLQTVHCLIVVQRKFPTVLDAKFSKTHFGGRELLNSESYAHLQRIFWTHSDTHIITHPAFESFGSYLADCKNLIEFWTQTVDDGIKTPTKLLEFLTLKIATDLLQNLKPEKAVGVIVELLSPNFVKMLINGLKQIKLKKDETLKAFYDEYIEALVSCCAKLPKTADIQKVAIIRRLIFYPGSFDIEKFTSTRIVHQLINTLDLEGIKEVFTLFKQIFCGTLPKKINENETEEWQHFERLNAGYMLQHLLAHKVIQHQPEAYEWRSEQLQFLLICGIFHVQQSTENDDISFEPCKKEAAGSFSKDFGEQCKNMFYASLLSKLSNLQHERNLLLGLIQFCNKHIRKQNFKRLLRIKLMDKNEELFQSAWKKMFNTVTKLDSNEQEDNDVKTKKSKKQKSKLKDECENKLDLVFHILLLNMGLQLFREVEMAAPAIDDLLNCMQRTKQQQKQKKKQSLDQKEESEPEWIEVVIDLFLHLLSQNAGALRNSVNNLFPHLCSNMNVSAIHQILAVLDMKDGQNPLSRKDDDEDSDDDNDEEEAEKQIDEKDSSDNDADSSDSEEEDDDDEQEDDDEDEDMDEDITATDKLRNAISQALMSNGMAGNDDDDDMASIDLNEITEEEGRRLDEALATAFKAMKKPGLGQGTERKKSKSQRVETTTVMHFRIRVLDLLEIYLQQPETDLLNNIEIMLALYNMLQYCWNEELKPLQIKVEKVLQKLTIIKPTGTTQVHTEELKSEDLVNYIRQIAEQKTPTLAFDLTNKIRNRCIVYLISNATKLTNGDVQVLKLCQEYQNEFLQSRNPTVNITLLSEIYKLRWLNIWDLALKVADKGLKMDTRAFRRIQVCEILAVLYRNNELQKLDITLAQASLKKVEKFVLNYIEALTTAWSKLEGRQSHKEFQTLLDLLLHAQRAHTRLKTITPFICSTEICEKVQELRRHIRLESTHIYHRYCGTFKLSVIRNSDVVIESGMNDNENDDNDGNENSEVSVEKGTLNQRKQKKQKNLEARKQKKQKKIERMLAASKGINGGFGIQKTAEIEDDVSENESD